MNIYLIHQILERAAKQTPNARAVQIGTESITYQQLDHASNVIAHRLTQQGIKPGNRVGIFLEKSIQAVISIYGILKTGACYVPLDIRSPAHRVAHIISDCQMSGVITSQKHTVRSKNNADIPDLFNDSMVILLVDIDYSKEMTESSYLNISGLIENDLAYILYTSGSTGTPKGVMLSHRASLTFINWAVDYFQPSSTDRFSSHAPFHFDLSVFDLFVAASVGACVYLIPPITSMFPRNLAEWIAQNKISIWYSAPSALIQLILNGEIKINEGASLRHIIFAGEVFPIKHFIRLRMLMPNAKYHNLYGPTETNVCMVFSVPNDWQPQNHGGLPIGKPCANMDVFTVDENGNSTNEDAVQELHVRSPGIMNGYWGKPKQTQAVMHVKSGHSGNIYRTGDLVKKDGQGYYHFVGRRDHQIKSRGYRVELGEIESTLLLTQSITHAIVTAVPDENAGNLLYAFLVLTPECNTSKHEIVEHCKKHLPTYMIPEKYFCLDEFPMTSTDKIDRNKLINLIEGATELRRKMRFKKFYSSFYLRNQNLWPRTI